MPGPRRGAAAAHRAKTILLPGDHEAVRAFVAAEAPIPVAVTADPAAPLGRSDLGILIVDSGDPALRAAATRLLADGAVPFVVLVRRDVWHAAVLPVRRLLDEVQRDPRRKLIRFWQDRTELERTLREEVFALDDWALVGQAVQDGSFVAVGSSFEQVWVLENAGFRVWQGRRLEELVRERLSPARRSLPLPQTRPGGRVRLSARFVAPAEPGSCRSVWQLLDESGRLAFPWSPGVRVQVQAVL